MNKFAHLHNHTLHSHLDGITRAEALMKRCRDNGMTSVAVTDHGTLGGIWEMKSAASKYGVNYIPGVEAYYVPDITKCHGKEWSSKGNSRHLVLLAQDNTGYKSLVALMSRAHSEGFYSQPRIDHNLLKQYSDGLICLSACLGSELAEYWRDGKLIGIVADKYRSIFGDRYFLEIQINGEPEQVQYNQALIGLSEQMKIPLVATNDCHYLLKEDSNLQDVNFCLGMGKKLSDPQGHGPGKRHKFVPEQYSVETPEEIYEAFSKIGQEEACSRAYNIAESCKVVFGQTKVFIPRIGSKDFEQETREGFKKIFGSGTKEYLDRLEYELEVIRKMGYGSYFMVVADYVQMARDLGILVGPGRGSGASSLVAYCLGITDVDPIKYGLYFERFLNPHRVSLPDFDTDFQKSKKDLLLSKVAEKYGADCVAHIGTQSMFKPRGLVRDIARVLGWDDRQDEFAKNIPEEDRGGQGAHRITLSQVFEKDEQGNDKAHYCHLDPTFSAKYKSDPDFKRVCDIAEQLESLPRHSSIHASGIIIHDKSLADLIPLGRINPETGLVVTEWDMHELEEAGYVKYDFLGLAFLDVIDQCTKMIREKNSDFDLKNISLDDLKVYRKIFHNGGSYGVFQFDKPGIRDFAKGFRPENIDDLAVILSVYRPGPMDMGMLGEIIKVRNKGSSSGGWTKLPAVAAILASTNGILVYQEQVLKISQEMAGFSLAEADLLRRAIGKKKPLEMQQLRGSFINGSISRGYTEESAREAFADICQFADYAFNKSHAVCYALIAYQTAYLKCYYPAEYMASMMTVRSEGAMQELVEASRSCGLEVLSPDINESGAEFKVKDGKILFGFGAINGIGDSAIEAILHARKSGFFDNIYSFAKKINLQKCRMNNILMLIQAGAFDRFGFTRTQLKASYENLIRKAKHFQAERTSGQMSLLSSFEKEDDYQVVNCVQDENQELMDEREALGLFLSGHPLNRYNDVIRSYPIRNISEIADINEDTEVLIAGFLSRVTAKPISRGTMAFITVGDKTDVIDVVVWPEYYKKYRDTLIEGTPVIIWGRINSYKKKGIVLSSIKSMDVLSKVCKKVSIKIRTKEDLANLNRLFPKYKGEGVQFNLVIGQTLVDLGSIRGVEEFGKEAERMKLDASFLY